MLVSRWVHGHNMQAMILLALDATHMCLSLFGMLYGHGCRLIWSGEQSVFYY